MTVLIACFIYSAVALLFIYVLISLYRRDLRNKKIKNEVLRDGVDTTAVITQVASRSGGNSGFINISIDFRYQNQRGEELHGKSLAVIDAMDSAKYQPGQRINIRYARTDARKTLVDIPNPLMKRKNRSS